MFKTTNTVVAGDYAGRKVKVKFFNQIQLCRLFSAPILVDETTVARYEVVSQDVSKSGTSALCRGFIGRFFFGTPGMIAGSLSAKNKVATTVSVEFKNGDRSLMEVDRRIYKLLMKKLFV